MVFVTIYFKTCKFNIGVFFNCVNVFVEQNVKINLTIVKYFFNKYKRSNLIYYGTRNNGS